MSSHTDVVDITAEFWDFMSLQLFIYVYLRYECMFGQLQMKVDRSISALVKELSHM